MALVLPDDVWLTNVTGTMPLEPTAVTATPSATPSAFPTAPTAFTLQGSTYSQAGVARLLARLQVVPDLKNVQLQSSIATVIGSQRIINFSIASDIQKGRGAS
jgi:Tfp pilus assembly protein PilN